MLVTQLRRLDIFSYNLELDLGDWEKLLGLCGPKIESLSLYSKSINNEFIKKIGHSCPNLKAINLFSLPSVNNKGINELTDKCKELNSIEVNFCSAITSVSKLANSNLLRLHLKYMQVDDNELQVISKACPKLESVDLTYNHTVTDTGIGYLYENCPNIQELILTGCLHVGAASIRGIANSLDKIQILDAVGCAVNSHEIEELIPLLRRTCLHLDQLNLVGSDENGDGFI